MGDAIGEPIEFLTLAEIRRRHGAAGITGPVDPGALHASDDTQMTLFTAEGLVLAEAEVGTRRRRAPRQFVTRSVHDAYQRWLRTQGEQSAYLDDPANAARIFDAPGAWLLDRPELHVRREPGNTCMGGLRATRPGSITAPLNDGAGCGGVMRIAPVGLVRRDDAFEVGCDVAALTHGHPWAYLPAGIMASVVADLCDGERLDPALDRAIERARGVDGHHAVVALLAQARAIARVATPSPERVESLGGGWQGHDALAIGVYCVLATGSWVDAVLLAANHGGDCDSTASIAGSLAALVHGGDGIPTAWIDALDLRDAVEQTAAALAPLAR